MNIVDFDKEFITSVESTHCDEELRYYKDEYLKRAKENKAKVQQALESMGKTLPRLLKRESTLSVREEFTGTVHKFVDDRAALRDYKLAVVTQRRDLQNFKDFIDKENPR